MKERKKKRSSESVKDGQHLTVTVGVQSEQRTLRKKK